MSYEYENRTLPGLPRWASGIIGALGQDADVSSERPNVPVSIPAMVPSDTDLAAMSDQHLTDMLNDAISEGWRIKSCNGPYCLVRAEQNHDIRVALILEYRRRQLDRMMPPIKEPIHTLAYGRYKLSKTIVDWSDKSLTGKLLWPIKIYMKSGASALEDIVGSQYLTAFIMSSPVAGVLVARRLGFVGFWPILIGGYLGMTAGALLPIALFSLSQLLGAAEEKDFLWAVS